MAARKKLTAAQKKYRQEARKELKVDGLIPPDKKPLRRRPYIDRAWALWQQRKYGYLWDAYLVRAIMYVLNQTERYNIRSPSLEAVGAAKVLLIALRLEQLAREREQGDRPWTLKEEYDSVKDILEE